MSAAAEDWTLCIDFGTAYSKAAAAPRSAWARSAPADVRPLMIGVSDEGGNPFLLDSALLVDDDRILFGANAINRANSLPHGKRMALRSFKTLLSAKDLERALNTAAPASIDPHRAFRMRDLILLYLAYLSAAVDRALAADAKLAKSNPRRRYAAPAWRDGDTDVMHKVVVALFGEAEALRAGLRDKALLGAGVQIAAAQSALKTAAAESKPRPMGLVFEATAAAAYTSIASPQNASHMIVLDMGAGTTDIAATTRVGDRIEELPEARVTVQQAGDHLDRIIANLAIDSRRLAKNERDEAALWTYLMRNMRDIKESIFQDGRAILSFAGRTLQLNQRDIDKDADFREFRTAISDAFLFGLEVLRDAATASGQREIHAVAVGGGASAPFVQSLIRQKPAKPGKITYLARPSTPDWAHADAFRGNLAPVFPQLSVAIGGALADEHMLAAPDG